MQREHRGAQGRGGMSLLMHPGCDLLSKSTFGVDRLCRLCNVKTWPVRELPGLTRGESWGWIALHCIFSISQKTRWC